MPDSTSETDSACAPASDVAPITGVASEVVSSPLPDPITPSTGAVIAGRFQIGEMIGQCGPVLHFLGLDLGDGQGAPIPIAIRWQVRTVETPGQSINVEASRNEAPNWPSLAWERRLLSQSSHLSLPQPLDSVFEADGEYLILEVPTGISLFNAWNQTPISWSRRCAWLIQIAEVLQLLHRGGAILNGVRPELIVVTPMRQAVIGDFSGHLPLLTPPDAPNDRSLYSAPELVTGGKEIDARADLYSFGAMVYSLLLGRTLIEADFTSPGVPRSYLERDADLHPLLSRLLARTFVCDVDARFPTADRANSDPTGFEELIETLDTCSRNLSAIRLEIAAWTSTGVVRSGNEDAVTVIHGTQTSLDESDDFALIVLADGMGGHASGEVAASLTIRAVRDWVVRLAPFANFYNGQIPERFAVLSQAVIDALHEANRIVFETAPREELGGMGCTAEVVVIDGNRAIIGHVGDSRVYHCRQGAIAQITRDQTIVNQLVLLGQLTEDEADNHPQRSMLQQAIGGHKEIYPDTYSLALEAGDWLLVCSDGLTNHLQPADIAAIAEAADSAERAARRLVNQTILEGATDNVSAVVVRVQGS